MKAALSLGALVLLLLALVVAGVAVAARPMRRWSLVAATALGVQGLLLLAFLPADDSYRGDGTSNWAAYDLELVALPAALGMLAAAGWLFRHPASRAAGALGPVAGLLAAFATVVSLVLTAN